MEETKKCAKCGKELCADCTCENDETVCKDCCGDEGEKEDKTEGCASCAAASSCCGEAKEEDKE